MTLSKNYTRAEHALASKMSRIRAKIKAGKASQTERALLSDYDRKRKLRNPSAESQPPQEPEPAAVPAAIEPPQPPAGGPAAQSAEVHSELPGIDGKEFVPPPLSVGGVAPPAQSTPPAQGSAPTATTGSAPPPQPKPAPAMSKEEAAASGEMVANLATQIITEFNQYNLNHGASGFDPKSDFFKLFHFSVKRLATKYGAAIDEDTYDALMITGTAGYVGYNSFKVYTAEKRQAIEAKPVAEEVKTNGQQPANGQSDPNKPRDSRTVFSGGPSRKFDPSTGWY